MTSVRWSAASIVAALLALVVVDGWAAVALHRHTHERARIKSDYADVNAIDQGLLSVDVWMGHLRKMVAHEMRHFALDEKERRLAKAELERVLDELLARIEQLQPSSLKGKLAKAAVGMMSLRAQVPALADGVLDKLQEPQSRRQLEKLAMEKLDEYAAESHDTANDRSRIEAIFARHGVSNRDDFNRVAVAHAAALQRQVRREAAVLVLSLVVVLAMWMLVHRRSALGRWQKPIFAISVVLALETLLAALSSPMLEIDARIRRVDFLLLGQHLRFDNQVLVYQSKSIFGVVRALFGTRELASMFVGVLILAFSILVPITKLIASEILLFAKPRLARNRLLQFLALKTGKWSMADVLVVATFMAYVGFRSILNSELADLNVSTSSLSSITTNQTSLEPAFIVFVAFVLFGLVLSELLKRYGRSGSSRTAP